MCEIRSTWYVVRNMSAELIKSKFVRRALSVRQLSVRRSSMVRIAIINEPCSLVSFKFGGFVVIFNGQNFVLIFEKKCIFRISRFFSVFINMTPYVSENFKNATPNLCSISFSMLITKVQFWIFEILSYPSSTTSFRKFHVGYCNI